MIAEYTIYPSWFKAGNLNTIVDGIVDGGISVAEMVAWRVAEELASETVKNRGWYTYSVVSVRHVPSRYDRGDQWVARIEYITNH